MSERYTARFEVRGPQQDLFERVSETALRWVWESFWESLSAEPPVDSGDGDWAGNGQQLRIRRGSADHLAFFTFVWTLPDPKQPDDMWTIEARLSTESETIEAEVRLGLSTQEEREGGDRSADDSLPGGFRRIKLIGDLLSEFDCYASGSDMQLSNEPLAVSGATVEQFVDDVLRSAERALPVVVVSKRSGESLWDPSDLQGRLAARALVASIEDNATRQMSDRLGRGMACYGGAMRIYQPGLTEEGNPGRHRFWLADAVERQDRAFLRELLSEVALLAEASRAVGDFDDVRARVLRAERQSATASLSHAAEDLEALYELLDEEAKRREEAEAERDQQRLRANQFEHLVDVQVARVEELEQELSELRDGAGIQVEDVRDAVSRARKQFSGLRFFKDAMRKQANNFRRPQEVYHALQILNSLSGELRRNSGVRRADWLKERGVDFSERESRPTMAKFGNERIFLDDVRDEHVEMPAHIKLGGGFGGAGTLRIHVCWDEGEGRWLVGYVGPHLRTVSG